MRSANQAESYNVAIVPALVESGAPYWRVTQVRHLTPAENRGRHHVFVDIVDAAGRPIRSPQWRIGWTWRGRRDDEPAPPQPLDKPLNEPAGNVELASTHQVTTVWIADGDHPSDAVEGLHTNHPDERGPNGELWNSVGHHSFYIQFQLAVATGGGGEEGEAQPGDLTARVAALEAWQATVTRHLYEMTGEL